MSDIKLSESNSSPTNYKLKSYTGIAVLLIIIIGCVLISGKLGENFFVIVLFVLIVLVPVILIFRKNLVSILPKPLSDNLLEIDAKKEENQKKMYQPSRIVKEIGMYMLVTVLLIGAGLQLYVSKKAIKEKKAVYAIFGALACIIVAGVIILEFEHVTN